MGCRYPTHPVYLVVQISSQHAAFPEFGIEWFFDLQKAI
jgi:hypothetical protein